MLDDEPDITALLGGYLERVGGYRVSQTHNGPALLELMRTDPARLVLLDLGLPDMDGLTLVDQVRARLPGIPVIVASGAAGAEGRDVVWLGKPYDEFALRSALDEALATSQSTASAE